MKSFYECNFFHEEWKETKKFSILQEELLLEKQIKEDKYKFKKINVEYKCLWEKQSDWQTRPTILIPIKDNSDSL